MGQLRGAVDTLIRMLTVCSLASACLITNCPKGGKRSKAVSEADTGDDGTCVRCGPGQWGRCLGPAVCCGPRLGCLVATPGIVSQCAGAGPLLPSRAKACITPSGLGVCATDGVCCNSESCHIDLSCEMEPFVDICTPDKTSLDTQF